MKLIQGNARWAVEGAYVIYHDGDVAYFRFFRNSEHVQGDELRAHLDSKDIKYNVRTVEAA